MTPADRAEAMRKAARKEARRVLRVVLDDPARATRIEARLWRLGYCVIRVRGAAADREAPPIGDARRHGAPGHIGCPACDPR